MLVDRGDTGTGGDAVDMHGGRRPHSATPQPNFVPVMPRTSRNTPTRGGCPPSTSTVRSTAVDLDHGLP